MYNQPALARYLNRYVMMVDLVETGCGAIKFSYRAKFSDAMKPCSKTHIRRMLKDYAFPIQENNRTKMVNPFDVWIRCGERLKLCRREWPEH
jgi:hypothetical protein